jgi:hypothetical protein
VLWKDDNILNINMRKIEISALIQITIFYDMGNNCLFIVMQHAWERL